METTNTLLAVSIVRLPRSHRSRQPFYLKLLALSGGQGMFGLPMEAKEVNLEELENFFPTDDVLEKWHNGEEAEWPPAEQFSDFPELRFDLGTSVLCRVGATDWIAGTIVQLWYREPQWPEGTLAPYKIKLIDGREIFAPADLDQIIKLNQTGAAQNEQGVVSTEAETAAT
jgi:hypothetical protein